MRVFHAWRRTPPCSMTKIWCPMRGWCRCWNWPSRRVCPCCSTSMWCSGERIKSGAANPAAKLTSVIAGMVCGADSVDDLDVVRSGGMKKLFDAVYAPSHVGHPVTGIHPRPYPATLTGAARSPVGVDNRTGVLAGIEERALVDIDSFLRPVYGHAKQGASFGHTKIANRQVLRKGLSPLATTISTEAAPVMAGIRLRAGRQVR